MLLEENETNQKDGLIDRWLAERAEMFVLYCRLTGKRKDQALPEEQQVKQFCQILIDYVSAGHFEVYEQVVADCATHGENSLGLLNDLFPKIIETTDIVVDFNDKYSDQGSPESAMAQLDADLSKLGEAIASRVELEDKLIEKLHAHH